VEAWGGSGHRRRSGDIELREKASEAGRGRPIYDYTLSAEKSVSLLHAGYRAAARKARDEHREQDAEQLEYPAKLLRL
jgi:hypothetical protein